MMKRVRAGRALIRVREHATNGTCCQKLAGDTAEDPFAQSAVAIAAGDDQVRVLVFHKLEELGGDRSTWGAPYLVCNDDPVAHEIRRHVPQILLRRRVALMLADFDEQNLFRLLQ
jgi:hypothetical protein